MDLSVTAEIKKKNDGEDIFRVNPLSLAPRFIFFWGGHTQYTLPKNPRPV